jgi:hypothetical protein
MEQKQTLSFVCIFSPMFFLLVIEDHREDPVPPKPNPIPRRLRGMPRIAALARDLLGWFDLDRFLEYLLSIRMSARCQALFS